MAAHNRIKELRNKKGLSQKEFAKAFSDFIKNDENVKPVSYATISRWERGENEPKLETWIKLAVFFGVSVSYLQGLDEDEERESIKILELKNDLKNGKNYQKKYVRRFLNSSAETSIDKLSEHDIDLIWDVVNSSNSLIGSLVDFSSFKTLEALQNVIKTLTVITSQYRLFSDDPEGFEKRIIPVVNEFLFELKKLE